MVRFDLKYTDSTTILFVKRASELQLFVPPGERECTEIEEHLESALGMPDRCSAALQIAYDRLAAPSVAVAEDDCKALLFPAFRCMLTAKCKQQLGE